MATLPHRLLGQQTAARTVSWQPSHAMTARTLHNVPSVAGACMRTHRDRALEGLLPQLPPADGRGRGLGQRQARKVGAQLVSELRLREAAAALRAAQAALQPGVAANDLASARGPNLGHSGWSVQPIQGMVGTP